MKTELTYDEFMDLLGDLTEIDSEGWRWGTSQQYHIKIDGVDYLTPYIRSTYDNGIEEDSFPCKLLPAEQVEVVKKEWRIVK